MATIRKKAVAATTGTRDVNEQAKQYFKTWKRVGPILEGIEFWACRQATATERARDLAKLLGCQRPGLPNDASGWLAWQKVRMRWMKHNETIRHKSKQGSRRDSRKSCDS